MGTRDAHRSAFVRSLSLIPIVMPEALSPAQREFLSLLQHDLPEETWNELRKAVSDVLARRVAESANRAWKERGYTDADAERMLHGHYRRRATPDNGEPTGEER